MKLQPLIIGNLIAKVPIVQGGMGIGISLSSLAGAVAKNGGIGVISAAQPGYRSSEFKKDPLKANLQSLSEEIQKARDLAEGGVIGVNIMCAANSYSEYVKTCVENKVDIIFSGAGLPTELPELVKGSNVKIAPILAPPKAVKTLLRLWDKRYQTTADAIVIEGPSAGGHLGFDEAEIEQYRGRGYDEKILEIIEIVKEYEEKYQKRIPVIFGGGVFSREDIDHYLSLGCQGVQMATRFVVTEECDADIGFKLAYLNAKEEDIITTKTPVGMLGRAIQNKMLDEVAIEKKKINGCYQCLKKCDQKTIPYCITQALMASAKGDVANGLMFCGENAWRLNELTTVAKLFEELNS